MEALFVVMLWLGALLLLLEALEVASRVKLGWLGLFVWILVPAIQLTARVF